MKFFLDTANLDEIRDVASTGILDGITTNPSLISKEGNVFEDQLLKVCSIVSGPVSAEPEKGRGGAGALEVDPVLLVHGREEFLGRTRRLRRPQEQGAQRLEGVVEDGQDPPLHPRLEVDEHISATDHIHAAEGRVPGHIVSCEDAHVADRLDHPVAAVHLGEELLQACRRDVLGDLREVASRSRLLNGALGEVGAEDLEGEWRPLFFRGLQ